MKDELVTTYRPIVNGAGLAGMGYFAFLAIKRFTTSEGLEFWVMGSLAVFFGLASLVMWRWTNKARTSVELEICCAVTCGALLINTTTHQLIRFQPENLVYFAVMMPVFAMLNLNMRMVVAWVTLCVVCMLGLAAWRLPDMVFEYVSICVASVLAAVGAARLVRGAVLNALSARLEAIHEREEAVRISEHDPLTGLPNRRSFFVAFNERREALHEKGRKFLLILVDLDGFKPVNDVYGHPAGDELLRAVSGRLKAASPPGSLQARLGGDEFAVLADMPRRADDVRRCANKIVEALSLPYSLEAGVVRVSGSAGVYVCERTDLRRGAMFERADHALYRAKQERRGEAVVFSDKHEADFLGENHVDRTLSQADLEAELTLEFQPQYDLVENRIAGFEALARWRSPQLGPVSPDVFIAAAERTTQMSRVTQVLLGKALTALEALPGHLRLAMNLSAHDLISETNVRRIVDRVRESGVDPTRLEFEITETAMLDDHETAARSLAELQDCGVSIALDDFGSGYSNFSYLQQLKVPKLKIDRSFVKPLMRDGSAAKILRTLVTLSKSLNMECVVEGVENPEELKRIDAMGARYVQGFLLAAPMPAAAIPQFLAEAPDSFEQMRRPRPASCSNLSYRRLA